MASEFSDHQQKLLDDTTQDLETDDGVLAIPSQPLQYKAARLAKILKAYDQSMAHSLKTFNAQGYLAILNEYTSVINDIKYGVAKKIADGASADENPADDAPLLDEGEVAAIFSRQSAAPTDGENDADGVDSGVPAKDLVPGERVNTL